MDSNRKFIDSRQIGNGDITIIKTSKAAEITSIVKVLDLTNTQHVIISTGTNDTDD